MSNTIPYEKYSSMGTYYAHENYQLVVIINSLLPDGLAGSVVAVSTWRNFDKLTSYFNLALRFPNGRRAIMCLQLPYIYAKIYDCYDIARRVVERYYKLMG